MSASEVCCSSIVFSPWNRTHTHQKLLRSFYLHIAPYKIPSIIFWGYYPFWLLLHWRKFFLNSDWKENLSSDVWGSLCSLLVIRLKSTSFSDSKSLLFLVSADLFFPSHQTATWSVTCQMMPEAWLLFSHSVTLAKHSQKYYVKWFIFFLTPPNPCLYIKRVILGRTSEGFQNRFVCVCV